MLKLLTIYTGETCKLPEITDVYLNDFLGATCADLECIKSPLIPIRTSRLSQFLLWLEGDTRINCLSFLNEFLVLCSFALLRKMVIWQRINLAARPQAPEYLIKLFSLDLLSYGPLRRTWCGIVKFSGPLCSIYRIGNTIISRWMFLYPKTPAVQKVNI